MSRQNLELVKEEINSAIEIARCAEQSVDDISAIDADTFKLIVRPLRRALRLVEPQQKSRTDLRKQLAQDIASILANPECPAVLYNDIADNCTQWQEARDNADE